MQQDVIPAQIVVIRDRIAIFTDYYNEPKNKKFFYCLALVLWVMLFMLGLTILPMTATSTYRVAFYLPLIIFTLLLAISTHWLRQCALDDYFVNTIQPLLLQHHNEQIDTFVVQ